MNIFLPTLNQIAVLFTFIAVGFLLAKLGFLPKGAEVVLAKVENFIFVPGLVISTFVKNFTVERISSAWRLLLVSLIIELVMIPVAFLVCKFISKDKFLRNIYTYGIAFANFGFMGNAVVIALFPDILFEYLIFTTVLQILIYTWAVPFLLIGGDEKKQSLSSRIKPLLNPMFLAMLFGIVIGLAKIPLPEFIITAADGAGSCMSTVAMLITGITVSGIGIKKAFTNPKIYLLSFLRLIVIPMAFIGIAHFLPVFEDKTLFICALVSLSMPLGLNTVVIPAAYGKDTSDAASMAVVSHILSVLTIPLIFWIAL